MRSGLGGRAADHRHRLPWFALAYVCRGVLAAVVFPVWGSSCTTVILVNGTPGLAHLSTDVTPTMLLERAGRIANHHHRGVRHA